MISSKEDRYLFSDYTPKIFVGSKLAMENKKYLIYQHFNERRMSYA